MNRRNFIYRSAGTAAAIPLAAMTTLPANMPGSEELSDPSDAKAWRAVRKLFPIPKDETYFNTGTLGVQPKVVLESVIDSMRHATQNAARTNYQGEGPLLLSGYEAYVNLRKKIGQLINADYREIALTQNATFGMNYLSNGLDLQPGDEILNTDQEHGGGRAGWQVAAARYGLVYKQAKISIPANDPQRIVDEILGEVTTKTKVIAIPHISSVYGIVLPVAEICREARSRGIITVIDGAQAVGQVKVDVKSIDCDAYFSSLHKWLLAPAGNGILYIRQEMADRIWTTLASYQYDNEDDHGFRLTQRGTGNPSLIVGLEAALDFHNQLGAENVIARIKYLGDYLREGLGKIAAVEIVSPVHPVLSAGLTTYNVGELKPVEVQNTMWSRGKLQPRAAGQLGLRQSTHIYTDEKDIDRGLAIVAGLAR